MASMKSDMDVALKVFLEEQRNLPGECQVTLAQFDNHYDLVYSLRDINEIPEYTIQPRGGTALLDAMGRFITDIGQELASRPEYQRPGKVLIVVITDGYENSSREWRRAAVNNLVTRQKSVYSWDFAFLGAGIDAVAVAEGLGIARGSSLTFTNDTASSVLDSMNTYACSYRTAGAASFTEQDRAKAMGDEEEE